MERKNKRNGKWMKSYRLRKKEENRMNKTRKEKQKERKRKSRQKEIQKMAVKKSRQTFVDDTEPLFNVSKESEMYKTMIEFEKRMKDVKHKKCTMCKSVSLNLKLLPKLGICKNCKVRNEERKRNGQAKKIPRHLPVWYDLENKARFDIPKELSELREGEKLMIQQIAPYIPLVHLRHGVHGSRGHVCSFPQEIEEICKILPRKKVKALKVIKSFNTKEKETREITFMVRRNVVLQALVWLKNNNRVYKDITIDENNMDWMEGLEEKELDVEVTHDDDIDEDKNERAHGEEPNRIFGMTSGSSISDLPSSKDDKVSDLIANARNTVQGMMYGHTKCMTIECPYVSPNPVDEHDKTEEIFVKAFPWLYPGGYGDINGYDEDSDDPMPLDRWIKMMLFYEDGRFARDKMWCFFVLNYWQRRKNQMQGSYFVDNFAKDCPQSLAELQDEIVNGNWRWIESITYYGGYVVGSPAYWRRRRDEIYSWINYHVQQENGPPSVFMTLSCAEYHWPDIERLLQERYFLGNLPIPNLKEKGGSRYVNEFTLVIQEYFQKRVETWIETVGTHVFKIKHYWLRYEFAPGRGQIHAHMLLILDNKEHLTRVYEAKDDEEKARIVKEWMEKHVGLVADIPNSYYAKQKRKEFEHPSNKRLCEVIDLTEDNIQLCRTCQYHVCTDYCLKKRKYQ